MPCVQVPQDTRAGRIKAEVSDLLQSKSGLEPSDRFVEVGPYTGAVSIEASRQAGQVTALERRANRVEVTQHNLTANETSAGVELQVAEAPAGLPTDADILFLGGSRNYKAVLDHVVKRGIDRVVIDQRSREDRQKRLLHVRTRGETKIAARATDKFLENTERSEDTKHGDPVIGDD